MYKVLSASYIHIYLISNLRCSWKANIFKKKNYNKVSIYARSDWLKQHTLSENKEQVNDIFASGFRQIWPKLNIPCANQTKSIINELFVSRKYGSWTIAEHSSVETGWK